MNTWAVIAMMLPGLGLAGTLGAVVTGIINRRSNRAMTHKITAETTKLQLDTLWTELERTRRLRDEAVMERDVVRAQHKVDIQEFQTKIREHQSDLDELNSRLETAEMWIRAYEVAVTESADQNVSLARPKPSG